MACGDVVSFHELECSIIGILPRDSGNGRDFAGKLIVGVRGVVEISGFEPVLIHSDSAFSLCDTVINGGDFCLIINGVFLSL